jgi:hypothetical protein
VHSSTGYTPYYLAYGREACIGSEAVLRGEGESKERSQYIKDIRHNLIMAHRHVTNRINAATDARDRQNDLLKHEVKYHIGDEVYVYHLPKSDAKQDLTQKLISPYQGPYRVTKILNDVTYQVEHTVTKKKKTVHVTKMKKKHKRPQHLIPDAEQLEPIAEEKLDERNQQQGDEYQSHATRRQIQREQIERQKQQLQQQIQQPLHVEQELKVNEPQMDHSSQHRQVDSMPVQDWAGWGEESSSEDELEEGEVVLPSSQ